MFRPLLFACLAACVSTSTQAAEALLMVVMDPLAAPLSCPCVEGYAQRKYEVLADYLERETGRPITVEFGETLGGALKKGDYTKAHIIIGKDSVVRGHAADRLWKVAPLARLTGKDGKTTQTGLIVVRSTDPAKSVKDLDGYRILYGPPSCDEKFAAPRKLLAAAGIEVVAAEAAETTVACSDGACKIIEWGDSEKAAAVISSYAAPLLEGCGTIQKGELRVVGETEPVPFVAAFATEHLSKELQAKFKKALLDMVTDPETLAAMETLQGFVDVEIELDFDFPVETDDIKNDIKSRKQFPVGDPTEGFETDAPQAWNGWRGPNRDGHAAWLPDKLPEKIPRVWTVPLVHPGLGGIAATEQFVLLGDRDATNTADTWRCLDAATGDELWTIAYPAPGQLDYDNFPRATPLVDGEHVFLFGAFGDLTCAELATGAIVWQTNIRTAFGPTDESVWGTCSSPLIVGDKLIVNPGSPAASLVALDKTTGFPVWQTPGDTAAYGSFIVAKLGGREQIIGHDRSTLGGWDPATGERLWSYTPPSGGDFNVPTPVVVGERLSIVTEGNSARVFDFADDGTIVAEPVGHYRDLAPDMSTPVVVGNRIFCVCDGLYVLDVTADGSFAEVYVAHDEAFQSYAPIIASVDRVLVFGLGGELILIDASDDEFRPLGRQHLFSGVARESEVYSHPAIFGTRLYVRGEHELVCVDLRDAIE